MRRQFIIKRGADGRAMLNVACGSRTHPEWNNMDFSPLVRLAQHPRFARILNRAGLLSRKRYERLLRVDPGVICWDLRKGIPFETATFEVVYHSHFLEHLDKHAASGFLCECRRVLKPCGIIRIVVPDLTTLCREYLRTFESLSRSTGSDREMVKRHERNVERLFEQMVRVDSVGTTEQPCALRCVERVLRGNASEAGETHRWMYDVHTLSRLLLETGFHDPCIVSPGTGRIDGWAGFFLDSDPDGRGHVPDSLYLEAVR